MYNKTPARRALLDTPLKMESGRPTKSVRGKVERKEDGFYFDLELN